MNIHIKHFYRLYSIVLILNGFNIFFNNYNGINLIQLNSLAIILLAIYVVLSNYNLINKKQKVFLFLNLFLFASYLFIGIVKSNYLSYILLDFTYFSCFSFSLVFASKTHFTYTDHLKYLYKSLFSALIVLFPFAIILLAKIGLSPVQYMEDRLNPDLEIDPYSAISLLSPSLILLLINYKNVTKLQRYIISISSLLITLFAFFTLSRGLILTIIFLFYFKLKDDIKKFNLSFFLKSFFFFLLFLFFIFYFYDIDNLFNNYNLLLQRFVINEDFSNGRNEEESLFLETLSTFELIFGRGFGGANSSWIFSNIQNGSPIMHKWYLHLILKGGVVFMIFFICSLIYILIKLLRTPKFHLNRYIYFFLVTSIGYTPFYSFLSMSFFWISFGFLLSDKNQSLLINYNE